MLVEHGLLIFLGGPVNCIGYWTISIFIIINYPNDGIQFFNKELFYKMNKELLYRMRFSRKLFMFVELYHEINDNYFCIT